MPAAIPFLVQPLTNLQIQGTSRLTYISTTSVELGLGVVPLKINGQWVAKAVSAAVALGNGGLSASTLYYVYAYDNAGATALEASATGHATDSAYGVEVKSGDVTWTLVGMLFTSGASLFVSSLSAQLVVSWFNRHPHRLRGTFSTNRTTASATWVEVNSEIRVEYLSWGSVEMSVFAQATASVKNDVLAASTYLALGSDGAVIDGGVQLDQFVLANSAGLCAASAIVIAEGYHYLTVMGRVSSGTGTYAGSGTNGERATISAQVII
jgi:hypothetical protein